MWLPSLKATRTPTGQAVLLGILFFFVFSAYITIQGFASKLYGEELASNMETTLYAVFTVACFVSPPIVNKLGPRLSIFLGVLGYGCLVASSLLLSLVDAEWCKTLVILGGAAEGVGAACLWTGQGRLILEWSDGTDAAHLFAVFWALFNCSALLGGVLAFFFFSQVSADDVHSLWPLFAIFFVLVLVGASLSVTLSRAPPRDAATDAAGEPIPTLTVQADGSDLPPLPKSPRASGGGGGGGDGGGDADAQSWLIEARETLKLFGTRRMAMLAPLFFYTGFNQPYQLNTIGNAHFTARALGIELVLFYGAEIFGGFVASHPR